MDYIAICKAFYSATGIPATLMMQQNGKTIYSSLQDMTGYSAERSWPTFYEEQNPVFCRLSPELEYGLIRIQGTGYAMVIGPFFSVKPTGRIIRAFLLETEVPPAFQEQITEYLMAIPRISHARYTSMLLMLHMWLNGETVSPERFYRESVSSANRVEWKSTGRMWETEKAESAPSYPLERRLYDRIREGDTVGLDRLLSAGTGPLHEGKLAASPLRQAKNQFIVSAAQVVTLSAIPGGLDAGQAYQLMETYIQECEQMQTIEAVYTLQLAMMRDYCAQVQQARLPEGISPPIFSCIHYIRLHINQPVSVEEVARQIGRSQSYLMKWFKKETGRTVGGFITECRLAEAKRLLRYSDKSLAEIASSLCFSSQAYFQSVFKKAFGLTPTQYRRKGG